jgi:transcriptional regulator with XRE-family HTH domain
LAESTTASRVAAALRELRESHWPDARLTQAQLAKAFGVSSATVSSWESDTNPKTPPAERLRAYARFFATQRSLTDGLIPDDELEEDELDEFHDLEERLLGLFRRREPASSAHRTFTFAEGPVTVICPEAPQEERGPLASASDPNFTKLQRYADLDALIEIFGHLRAANPDLDVFHRIPPDVNSDDLSTHVVLLGGILWNKVTRRFQDAMKQVPITQVSDPALESGEIFQVDGANKIFPVWEDPDPGEDGGERELSEDVAFLARIPNPFNGSRTLTVCNGIHSRGVYGAVRCLTDRRVRDANERYLAERFPDGRFALLLRVPVVANETISPDLQNETARLYEWPPRKGNLR